MLQTNTKFYFFLILLFFTAPLHDALGFENTLESTKRNDNNTFDVLSLKSNSIQADLMAEFPVNHNFEFHAKRPNPTSTNETNPLYTLREGIAEPFKDAINLQRHIQNHDWKKARDILKDYKSNLNTTNWETIKADFQSAPLLINELNRLIEGKKDQAMFDANRDETESTEGLSLSGLNPQTLVIDALGKLIAKRFREELNIAYIDKFRKELEEHQAVAEILPNAFAVLKNNDPIDYKSFIPALREALHEDVIELTENIPELLEMAKDKGKVTLNTEAYQIIQSAFFLVNNRGESAADILADLPLEAFMENKTEYVQIVKLLKLFSENLRAEQGYKGWLSPKDLSRLREGNTFQLFAGLFLLKEQEKLKQLGLEKLQEILTPDSRELAKFFRLYRLIEDVQEKAKKIQDIQLGNGKVDLQLINNYLGAILNIFEHGINFEKAIGNINVEKQEKALKISRDVLDILTNIAEEDYAKAIVHTIGILNEVLPNQEEIVTVFTRYGNLAIALIEANSSDEALVALESVALPVGSYRIKRSNRFDVSLNSYAGIFGGFEKFYGNEYEQFKEQALLQGFDVASDTTNFKNPDFVFGFTAPIGPAFSFGSQTTDSLGVTKQGHAFTIFTSLIDIGAVVNFRLNDQTSVLPEVDFKNVFAPGFHLVWGIKNSPIALSAGVQYGPELRTVTAKDIEKNVKAWRFGAGVTVDIPIFRIYTIAPK